MSRPNKGQAPAVAFAPRAVVYLTVVTLALVGAVTFHLPQLAALGLPALVLLAGGLALDAGAAAVPVTYEIDTDIETLHAGTPVTVTLRIAASARVPRFTAALTVPPELAGPQHVRLVGRLSPPAPAELTATLTPPAPGRFQLGPITISSSGHAGLLWRRSEHVIASRLEVRPVEQRLRTLPRSHRVRVPVGDRLSRRTGDGIEFAEVRPEVPGDPARSINWRVTARRQSVHVTLRHPEQSTDVVLLADTFEEDRLSRVLSLTASAAAAYLERRDRVGLVCFGGVLDWVEAGMGPRQLERIRARLATATPFYSYAWKNIERVPRRALPPGAIVVAISPLQDPRFLGALGEMRARGHEVVIVEVAPGTAGGKSRSASTRQRAAELLVRLEHEEMLHRLYVGGIPVVTLQPDEALEGAFSALEDARRRTRMRAVR